MSRPVASDELKLFLWRDVLKDYTSGVIFALAHNIEEARQCALQSANQFVKDSVEEAIRAEPEVITASFGFVLSGGA